MNEIVVPPELAVAAKPDVAGFLRALESLFQAQAVLVPIVIIDLFNQS